jgi:hypothetical protein
MAEPSLAATKEGTGTGLQEFSTYTSPRDTPELGAAERLVHTIKEMTATMPADSKLPSEHWSHAARYPAVFLVKTSAKTLRHGRALRVGRATLGRLGGSANVVLCRSRGRYEARTTR